MNSHRMWKEAQKSSPVIDMISLQLILYSPSSYICIRTQLPIVIWKIHQTIDSLGKQDPKIGPFTQSAYTQVEDGKHLKYLLIF